MPSARILIPSALARLALGWAAVLATALALPADATAVATASIAAVLAAIVTVIVVAAIGVLHQAEALAARLGDPYGTLVLTLSIVMIEVVLIAAVMLGPGEHATIARDSVSAVSMIILNLVTGICLVIGGIRHEALRANRTGAAAYFAMLWALGGAAFLLPGLIGTGGAFLPAQAAVIAVLTLAAYALFLVQQMGPRAGDYQEVVLPEGPTGLTASPSATSPAASTPAHQEDSAQPAVPRRPPVRTHAPELIQRTALLILTVVPIVLLSHDMAALVDVGLARTGAPAALAGVLIALSTVTLLRPRMGIAPGVLHLVLFGVYVVTLFA